MKYKYFKVLLCLCCLLFILVPAVQAEENILNEENQDLFLQQLEDSGAKDLLKNLPEETNILLEKYHLTSFSPQQLLSLSPADFFSILLDLVKQEIFKPVKMLATVLGLVILCAILESYKTTLGDKPLTGVFSVIAVLATLTVVVVPLSQFIRQTSEMIGDLKNFMLAFIPVFTGIITASGQAVSALAYNSFLFGFIEITASFLATAIIPFLSIYLSFCIVSGVNPAFRLNAVAETIRKAVGWILGIIFTFFIGLWSLQNLVSVSADTLALKTTKFAVSSMVPVVGGSLSEALGSVTACLRLLKTTVGTFSIVGLVLLFMPVLLRCILWQIACFLAASVAEMFEQDKIASVLRAVANVFMLLVSILLCFAMMLVIATTILLVMGGNVV